MQFHRLTKDLIGIDASMWVMAMRYSASALDVMAYSLCEDNSLISACIPLDEADAHRSLEKAVYDNPLLLMDFKRTYCIIEPDALCALPPQSTDSEIRRPLLKEIWPDFDEKNHEIIADITPGGRGPVLAGCVERDILTFFRRTFPGIRIASHLSPLVRYFMSTRGNTPKLYANLRKNATDIVVIDGGSVLMANTFATPTDDDAAFIVLTARSHLGLAGAAGEEIMLSGNAPQREALTAQLRKFAPRVLPVVFPPRMYRVGREIMHLPFDLTVTPICE